MVSENEAEYAYGYEVCNEVAVIVDIVIVKGWKEQVVGLDRGAFCTQLLVRWLNHSQERGSDRRKEGRTIE